MYGLKHSLALVRKTDDDAIFLEAEAVAEKVSLDKMSWIMPHIISSDAEKFSIYKTIESQVKLPVAYRARQCDTLSVPESTSFTWRLSVKTAPEKPRFIIVGFQTDIDSNQKRNSSTFNHVNLTNAYVTLNSDRYPHLIIIYRSQTGNCLECIVMQPCLELNSFGMDELITQCNITPSDY